ncbi:hypothetical protein [Companilactobacillus mishanensis]|uniref:Uncharacterized protein n=1 Tax=Companilactobacillus mishanensis TaxID=2486008 RepID=A0A5P0ZGN1_9LACO|nr:hypothetical protein [Companilactobacillus mishanensis]MQS52145.1 hypothetical protein [Companilactobacillus mishanensis]MQS88261.1 hypothetical protein [Companilactobacillus mishanensis]
MTKNKLKKQISKKVKFLNDAINKTMLMEAVENDDPVLMISSNDSGEISFIHINVSDAEAIDLAINTIVEYIFKDAYQDEYIEDRAKDLGDDITSVIEKHVHKATDELRELNDK